MAVPVEVQKVYDTAVDISRDKRPYVYGGGHWPHKLSSFRRRGKTGMDCSSSTSWLFKRTGHFKGERAYVSWEFAHWGLPGEGKHVTVWYNSRHVFVKFTGIGRFARFDTSAWGFGQSGVRIRRGWRPTKGFTPRHWPGM